MFLLVVALFGLVVPNGLFVYWLTREYHGARQLLSDHLAIAFLLDAFLALGLLAYAFAVRPIGRVRWYWFVLLSLVGGLGFGLPLYWWLNARSERAAGEG